MAQWVTEFRWKQTMAWQEGRKSSLSCQRSPSSAHFSGKGVFCAAQKIPLFCYQCTTWKKLRKTRTTTTTIQEHGQMDFCLGTPAAIHRPSLVRPQCHLHCPCTTQQCCRHDKLEFPCLPHQNYSFVCNLSLSKTRTSSHQRILANVSAIAD